MTERRFVLVVFTHVSREGCPVALRRGPRLSHAARYRACRRQQLTSVPFADPAMQWGKPWIVGTAERLSSPKSSRIALAQSSR